MTELNFKGQGISSITTILAVPFRPLVPHPEKGIGALDGNLIIHALRTLTLIVAPHHNMHGVRARLGKFALMISNAIDLHSRCGLAVHARAAPD